MQQLLRQATPLVLLGLGLLVWFERFLPGSEWIREEFGRDFVLRFVVGLLCLYMVMLMVDRARLEHAFKELIHAFRDFSRQAGGGGSVPVEKQLEAAEILIGALQSADAAVRANAVEHLQRLTGQSFGEEPEAWQAWLREQRERHGAATPSERK